MRNKALIFSLFAATLMLALPSVASAAGFSVLHNFNGTDGETPAAALIQGSDGFFYGVAAHGGNFTVLPPDGGGTAFRMDANGNVTTLHTFAPLDGVSPTSLIQGPDGSFYGAATYGGLAEISPLLPGPGTIFRMNTAGVVTVLYVFPGGNAGHGPGPVVRGSDGAFYGSALGGSGGDSSIDSTRSPAISATCTTSSPATGSSRPGRSFRRPTGRSTERRGRVGLGTRASSTRLTLSATSFFFTPSRQPGPVRALSREAE